MREACGEAGGAVHGEVRGAVHRKAQRELAPYTWMAITGFSPGPLSKKLGKMTKMSPLIDADQDFSSVLADSSGLGR
ncbi:hypothetical protein GA0115259_1040214 [Streptomyces sp. MnatMP-M17]|nr:hypothetical protein GA0115259_1040214 [Streptomyces sp. MnatMP-M17]